MASDDKEWAKPQQEQMFESWLVYGISFYLFCKWMRWYFQLSILKKERSAHRWCAKKLMTCYRIVVFIL